MSEPDKTSCAETLADIAKKCRDEEIARNMASITSAKAMGAILNDLADRIEAAAERERARAEAMSLNESIIAREEEAAEWRRRTGNVTAMRAALEKVLECYKSGAIRTVYNDPESWRHDDELCSLKDDVEAALSAPPRNCDRYRTADEAREAHANSDDWLMAFGDWLFAPAKERKGETDGSK